MNTLIIVLTLVCLGFLLFKRSLSERTLALGPTRDPGFSFGVFAFGAYLCLAYVVLLIITRETSSPLLAMLISLYPFALIGLAAGRCKHMLGGYRIVGLLPRHPKRDLRWSAMAIPVTLLFSWTIGLIVMELSARFGFRIEAGGHDTLVDLVDHFTVGKLLVVVFFAVIMAPLIEELVFRGVMQTCLLHVFGGLRWPAMIVTAILFSVTHAWVVPWQSLVTLFALGLIFGYVYERTGSLLTPILVHAGFNAANVIMAVMLYTAQSGY